MTVPIRACGVALDVVTEVGPHTVGTERYEVSINGETHVLYDIDLDEPGVPTSDDPWMDCAIGPEEVIAAVCDDDQWDCEIP